MKRIRISLLLMILTIIVVSLGQTYWLLRLYDDEYSNLRKGMDVQFRNSFYQLQRTRFLKDSLLFSEMADTVYIEREKSKPITQLKEKSIPRLVLRVHDKSFIDSQTAKDLNKINPKDIESIRVVKQADQLSLPPELMEMLIIKSLKLDSVSKIKNIQVNGVPFADTLKNKQEISFALTSKKIALKTTSTKVPQKMPIIRMITNNKTLNDSIPLDDVRNYFHKTLSQDQQNLTYFTLRKKWNRNQLIKSEQAKDTLKGFITSEQLSGIKTPFSYRIVFPDIQSYILNRMVGQIAGSSLMICILIMAFGFIYHTMRRQLRLSEMKNEFISNITHELKTPIATVHVALEALQNFKALDDRKKTKEYLDISMSELSRLELLVDNVLKRSMLEKDAIKMEPCIIDVHQIIQHVILTSKLKFEKSHAIVNVETEGKDFTTKGDKLHMTGVVYTLLDNAIKYSIKNPEINIKLTRGEGHITLAISDKGIGIPKAYQDKIFQPFFRVPKQDQHNAKGHGLGLSYVAQIIKLHQGSISVSSKTENGTVFTIQLPVL